GDARALDSAARACDAVGRLFETGEPHPGVFNLLCRHLALLNEQTAGKENMGTNSAYDGGPADGPAATDESSGALPSPGSSANGRAGALAFRLKLLLAAGLAPQLG